MTEERASPAPRSRRRPTAETRAPETGAPTRRTDGERRPAPEEREAESRPRSRNGGRINATTAARRAAQAVAELTGHTVETVISIEPCDDGWKIGVEVVETHRIPDSADILASYEAQLDASGDLVSYRRTHRYARGQLHGDRR